MKPRIQVYNALYGIAVKSAHPQVAHSLDDQLWSLFVSKTTLRYLFNFLSKALKNDW